MNTQKKGANPARVNAQWEAAMPNPHRYFTTKTEDTINGLIRVISWSVGLVSLVLAGCCVDSLADTGTIAGFALVGLGLILVGVIAGRMEEMA